MKNSSINYNFSVFMEESSKNLILKEPSKKPRLSSRFHLNLLHHMSVFVEGIEFTVDEDRAVCVFFTCVRVEIVGVVINCDEAS